MKIKKIALMLVMAISINMIGASFVFAASPSPYNTTAVNATDESQTKASTSEAIRPDKEGGVVQPNSIGSAAVKAAAKWLKDNWAKVYAKIPDNLKKYFVADKVFEALDIFVGISDTIDAFLTNVVNYLLPSSLEYMTPTLVKIIGFFLPL
ncbi:hypothetical protein UF75_5184 [Desulfosporosinus sp. I2]|uniref:hypothetical protein n=1 Tax=Desulfosporosinus sp. I2 TaxID=1617025 RepID=UPI0005EE1203|nr:hypothetical protein [Desulfosporosinus sp. I2]KJR44435.1 hypothetical protein UF75_5184 [Desulfosporosinus sp. I2]